MDENEEVENKDQFDKTTFQEEFFDIDDNNIENTDLIEDINIVENMFLENKRFEFDEENCSNINNNNINSLGIK
jgi:hypothetical protein